MKHFLAHCFVVLKVSGISFQSKLLELEVTLQGKHRMISNAKAHKLRIHEQELISKRPKS